MSKTIVLLVLSSIVACAADADDGPQDPPACEESHCISLACESTDAGVLCTCGLQGDTYITCSAE